MLRRLEPGRLRCLPEEGKGSLTSLISLGQDRGASLLQDRVSSHIGRLFREVGVNDSAAARRDVLCDRAEVVKSALESVLQRTKLTSVGGDLLKRTVDYLDRSV